MNIKISTRFLCVHRSCLCHQHDSKKQSARMFPLYRKPWSFGLRLNGMHTDCVRLWIVDSNMFIRLGHDTIDAS